MFFFACRNCASSLSDVCQSAFTRDAVDSGLLVLLCFVFMGEKLLEELIGGAVVDFNIFFWEDSFNLMGSWAGARENYSKHVFLLWPNGFLILFSYLVSLETILSENLLKTFELAIKMLRIADWTYSMNEDLADGGLDSRIMEGTVV